MLPDAPVLLELLFFGITAACLLLLYNALETISKKTATVAITFLVVWSMMQSALADNGFYRDYQTMPPRLFVYGLFPILSVISFVLIYPATRARLLQVCLEGLTWIHVIRIPVELSLLWLFVQKAVPQAMTFDGMNFVSRTKAIHAMAVQINTSLFSSIAAATQSAVVQISVG